MTAHLQTLALASQAAHTARLLHRTWDGETAEATHLLTLSAYTPRTATLTLDTSGAALLAPEVEEDAP